MNNFFTHSLEVFSQFQPSILSPRTISRKKHHITNLLNYLESQGIQNFSDFDIGRIYEFITSLPYASQTISNMQFAIREYFNLMFESGLSSFDGRQVFPVIFTNKRDRIISYYQDEEVRNLINAIDISQPDGIRDKCMVLLAAQTGLRAGDITHLTFDEIVWDKNLISKKQHKTSLPVVVPLPENVKLLLVDYIKNYRPDSRDRSVFICPDTYQCYCDSELYYIANKYFRRAEISIGNRRHGPHALRHSLASNLLKNNTPMPVITGILGHKDINTTSKYLSIDIESLRLCCLEVPYA